MNETRAAFRNLAFPIGYLLFYYLSAWLGIDILGIPLMEAFPLLGADGTSMKVLMIGAPLVSMLAAAFFTALLFLGKRKGNPNRPWATFASFPISLIALTYVAIEYGGSIILGGDRYLVWMEGLGATKFKLQFGLLSPVLGLLGAFMVAVIFRGEAQEVHDPRGGKERSNQAFFDEDRVLPEEVSPALARFFGSLGFFVVGMGSLLLGNHVFGLGLDIFDPFSGMGMKGILLVGGSLFLGTIGLFFGMATGASIRVRSAPTQTLISYLWHYGANGSVLWALLSIAAMFITLGAAGLKDLYHTLGPLAITAQTIAMGIAGGWAVCALLSMTKRHHLLSVLSPLCIGVSMGVAQSFLIEIPFHFQVAAGICFSFVLLPVTEGTIRRDLPANAKPHTRREPDRQHPSRGYTGRLESDPIALAEIAIERKDLYAANAYLQRARRQSLTDAQAARCSKIESDILKTIAIEASGREMESSVTLAPGGNACWRKPRSDNRKQVSSIFEAQKEERRQIGVVTSAIRMATAFAVAGFCSALASIYDLVSLFLVLFMIGCVLYAPYCRTCYEGTGTKYDLLMVWLKSLPFFAVILIVLVPHVANYIGAWGLLWGMTAVFMTNMLYRQFGLCRYTGMWLVVMFLCWFYAYASDNTLRFLWGSSPYDLETVFYGMHAFFGAAAATTITITYCLVRITPKWVLLTFLLSGVGFFLGDILSIIVLGLILMPLSLLIGTPAQTAVVCLQTVSALFGGVGAGIAVGLCSRSLDRW